ncbi:GntR family transcriptional regulator [Falsigemmobacter faecalis]|uniref:GntR family transcriptional regulator n=1 Tax=Falsigemmobacter faecalis TaxID=2488730 RepID=A0A3P3DFI5_9RHOB|nr:GntR family transcriptional regulator [Falsigemmobacter faecalis]RRH73030.1 GntR family transcriptional regulator [Falsigemmobacter faecalis]
MTDSTSSAADATPNGVVVYRRLLEEIGDGILAPGARLREVDLAARLGYSRTPVREAIRLLESDGLVVHLPRQGAAIRVLDYAEVMELYEMRMVLEGTAARLAARMAGEAELRQLQALNEDFRNAPDEARAVVLNRQFHQMLLEAARNRFLQRSVRGLQKTMLILGKTTLHDLDRTRLAAQEHDTILAALCARDGIAAEAAMRAHMEAAQVARLHMLRAFSPTIED